jgi:hypothetical protein
MCLEESTRSRFRRTLCGTHGRLSELLPSRLRQVSPFAPFSTETRARPLFSNGPVLYSDSFEDQVKAGRRFIFVLAGVAAVADGQRRSGTDVPFTLAWAKADASVARLPLNLAGFSSSAGMKRGLLAVITRIPGQMGRAILWSFIRETQAIRGQKCPRPASMLETRTDLRPSHSWTRRAAGLRGGTRQTNQG